MALVLGTNCGYCRTAPVADPEGYTSGSADTYARAMQKDSPAGATKINEVGFYVNNATQEANFEVGLYDADENLLYVERTNAKGTGAGWKKVTGLNWEISPSTTYKIAVQLDDTATASKTNYGAGSSTIFYTAGATTLADPANFTYGGGSLYAIYAVYNESHSQECSETLSLDDSFSSLFDSNGDFYLNLFPENLNLIDTESYVWVLDREFSETLTLTDSLNISTDITVETSISNSLDTRNGLHGPYWISPDTGLIVFLDINGYPYFAKTTDGGENWSSTVIEEVGVRKIACWFDQETPGDAGTLVHITYLDLANNDSKYTTVDINDDTIGTIRTIDSGITVSSNNAESRVAITKTVGGNLLMALSTQSEIECYRSIDDGVNWVDRADPFETTTEEDWLLLYPANTGDDNDACGIFWDRSTDDIFIKMYDDSENTWTKTEIDVSPSYVQDNPTYINMDAAVRHSDGHILFAIHNFVDNAIDDLRTFDITPDSIASPTYTAKTNIFTDQNESAQVSVLINQQNDDVYVAYLKGGTWQQLVDVVFHKSDDGMDTWGAEQAYSEALADDNRLVSGGRTIGASGGKIQFSWYNDDLTDIFVNTFKDIEISEGTEQYSETYAETISLNDTYGRVWLSTPEFTEILNLTDTDSWDWLITQEFTETLTLSDSITRGVGTILSETLDIADTYSRVWISTPELSTTLNFTDVFIQSIQRELTETLTLTDTVVAGFVIELSETLTLSDTYARVWLATQNPTESITLSDGDIYDTSIILSETINLTDSVVAVFSIELSENIALTENLLASVEITLSETLALSDNLIKSYTKFLSESPTLSDNFVFVYDVLYSETLNLNDTYSGVWLGTQLLSETLTLTDTITTSAIEHTQELTETLNLSDGDIYLISFSLFETLSLSDIGIILKEKERIISTQLIKPNLISGYSVDYE